MCHGIFLHLGVYMCDTILSPNPGLSYELLQVWYEAYQKVISLQALKVHLYMIPVAPTEEAKFNIMNATFLAAQIYPALTQEVLMRAGQVFTTLFCRYFEHSLKVRMVMVEKHTSSTNPFSAVHTSVTMALLVNDRPALSHCV